MPWFANAAEAVITPPVGVEILEPRSVPTDLYVRALALRDGQTTLVIVTLDLLGLDPHLVAQIRQAVQRRTGIAPSSLMLTTSVDSIFIGSRRAKYPFTCP